MEGEIHSEDGLENPCREASNTHTGTDTLQDNLFLSPSSVIWIHTYYPPGLLPYVKQHSAASVQDLATFTPCQGYLVPVSHSLAASKCHSVLATAVSSRCSLTVASQGCIFLPLCSVTLCFTSEVFVGSLPGHCFQAGSQLKVPCFPASCQQVPFSLLKVFAAAGGRGRRLSRVCTGKGRVG